MSVVIIIYPKLVNPMKNTEPYETEFHEPVVGWKIKHPSKNISSEDELFRITNVLKQAKNNWRQFYVQAMELFSCLFT